MTIDARFGLVAVLLSAPLGCRFQPSVRDAYHASLVEEGRDVAAARARGAELFVELQCIKCHWFEGRSVDLGINLTDVGFRDVDLDGRINLQDALWLERHFVVPAEVRPGSLMPEFGLNKQDAEALTTLMLDFRHGHIPEDLAAALERAEKREGPR